MAKNESMDSKQVYPITWESVLDLFDAEKVKLTVKQVQEKLGSDPIHTAQLLPIMFAAGALDRTRLPKAVTFQYHLPEA